MRQNLNNSNNVIIGNESRTFCPCELCKGIIFLLKCIFTFIFYLLYYILIESFYLFRFIVLFPYIFMLYNLFEKKSNDLKLYLYILLFIPFFICFSIMSISLFSIFCFPSVYITKYRKMIKKLYNRFLDKVPFALLKIKDDEDNNDNN